MIVWIASYPRSGNTLFRIVVNHLYGIQTRSLYNDTVFEERPGITEVVGHLHTDLSIDELAASPEMHFVKTHEVPGDDAFPAVYIVRDGRDALVSYAHFIGTFEPSGTGTDERPLFADTLRDLVQNRGQFGGWGPHVTAWRARRAPTAIVSFEALVADPRREVLEALGKLHLGVPGTSDERPLPSFDDLHALLPDFFRAGQTGRWRAEMSGELEALFWANSGPAMTALGYTSGS